jgi:methyl-accepting chemotaxis protein
MKAKLQLGFGLLLVGILVVGAIGTWSLVTVAAGVRGMYETQLLSMKLIADTRTQVAHSRMVLQHVAAADAPAREKAAARIRTTHADAVAKLDTLDRMALTAPEKAALAKFREAYQQFADVRDSKVIALSDAGRREDAQAAAEGAMDVAYRAMVQAGAALVEQKDAAAKTVYEGDVAVAGRARSLMIAVVVLSFAVGVVLAIVIGRSLVRAVTDLAEVTALAAEGDLTARAAAERQDELGAIAAHVNRMLEAFHDSVSEARRLADETAGASKELSNASTHLSAGTQAQAAALEETAASLEQITGTVRQSADNARQANQLAAGARDVAGKGGEVVTAAVRAMGTITESSHRIAAIIATIDEIAFQTNLLALNAAVEAARAGEQGRGFAVVAAEVRNLAQRAAGAAKEIKALIEDSVGKVETGAALVNQSGQTLEEIVTSARRVTDIVAEIAEATGEQSTGIDQVNQAVARMDECTQSNAAQMEELTSTAASLATQAVELQALVARFKVDAGTARRGVASAAKGFDVAPWIQAHLDWKEKLTRYLGKPDRSLDSATVSRDDACALGKWLVGEGRAQAGHAEYEAVRQEHTKFHRIAGEVIQLADHGRAPEGWARVRPGGDYAVTSRTVVDRLKVLARVASAGPAAPVGPAVPARRAPKIDAPGRVALVGSAKADGRTPDGFEEF